MTALIPVLPAALALTGTIVQAATEKGPPSPGPLRPKEPDIDQELRDAWKRRSRQSFAAEDTVLGDEGIGASFTGGGAQTLVGV